MYFLEVGAQLAVLAAGRKLGEAVGDLRDHPQGDGVVVGSGGVRDGEVSGGWRAPAAGKGRGEVGTPEPGDEESQLQCWDKDTALRTK